MKTIYIINDDKQDDEVEITIDGELTLDKIVRYLSLCYAYSIELSQEILDEAEEQVKECFEILYREGATYIPAEYHLGLSDGMDIDESHKYYELCFYWSDQVTGITVEEALMDVHHRLLNDMHEQRIDNEISMLREK